MALPMGYVSESGHTTTGKPYTKVCHVDGTCAMRVGSSSDETETLVALIEHQRRMPVACEESGDAS